MSDEVVTLLVLLTLVAVVCVFIAVHIRFIITLNQLNDLRELQGQRRLSWWQAITRQYARERRGL